MSANYYIAAPVIRTEKTSDNKCHCIMLYKDYDFINF